MTNQQLWTRMAPDDRLRAAHHFWRCANTTAEIRKTAIATIAKALRTREAKVRTASQQQLENWLSQVLQLPEEVADILMRAYLLGKHQQMITSFLNDLGIPHIGGVIVKEFDPSTLPTANLPAAAERLMERYGSDTTGLYFAHLSSQESPWGEAIRRIGRTSPKKDSTGSDSRMNPGNPVEDEDRLTDLDRLLEQAIIASVARSDGALSTEQIENVIGEMLRVNPHRARSYYHRGFLDVTLERPIHPHFREENRDRRLWYLTGAIRALEDRTDRTGILNLFDREELKDLGREKNERSKLVAGIIFKCLCEEKRVSAAVEFLAPSLAFHADVFEWALDFGTKLLRTQEIEAALKVFELLDSALRMLNPEQVAPLRPQYFDLKRRQAHCLRYQRHFGEATKILRELLKDASAPERSAMTVDVALMNAGYRGLLDVVIPEKDRNQFIDRLEGIRPELEAAESLGGDTAHATYCLGVLAIAKQDNPDRAAEWLDKSVTSILRHSTSYDLGGLLSRARFYMGLARAETLNASFAEKAGVLFREAIDAGFVPPEHLLSRYLISLAVINADVAKRVAEIAVAKLGASSVLDPILETEVASQSGPILESLLAWALDEKRSGRKRFHDLQGILEQAINGRHVEIASVALDEMELLARDGICTDEFLLLLTDDAKYHPVWSTSDAAWSAVALCERTGRLLEARAILQREFHRTLADKPHGFLEQTADILDKTRRLVADRDELAAMERRLAEVQIQVPDTLISESLHDVPVRITVVGGDERQARYDKAIVEGVKARFGAVEVEFRHTGWSGRWGPEFDAMRGTLDRSDAVVVMRLIRTNLGCKVRDYSKRWIGCAGYSKSSIEAAIRVGVDLVRREKR
jgi:hypothetical protein